MYGIDVTNTMIVVRRMPEENSNLKKSYVCVLQILSRHVEHFTDINFWKGDGVGNEIERFTRSNCKRNNEALSLSNKR